MAAPVYYVEEGDTLPIDFDTFDGGTGASITMTGLAVTDIEIYKDTSTTQRASDNGYALQDTDGIDLDGITGIQGFSVDLSDNSDAGFYTVGPWFRVVVSAITVDGQTVNFIAARFRIISATRGMAGTALPAAAADAAGGLVISDAGGLDADAQRADVAAILVDTGTTLDGRIPAALVGGRMDSSTGAMAANVLTATAINANAINAAKLDPDVTTELQSGLATAAALATAQASLDTIDDLLDTEVAAILAAVDTEVAAIKAVTDLLPNGGALSSLATQASVNTIDDLLDTEIAAILAAVDTEVAAIKVVTDALPNAGALSSLAQDATVAKTALFTTTTRNDPAALAAALAAGLTPLEKLDWVLSFVARMGDFNKTTGERIAYNAAGVAIAKMTCSDDGTTTERGQPGAP